MFNSESQGQNATQRMCHNVERFYFVGFKNRPFNHIQMLSKGVERVRRLRAPSEPKQIDGE